MRRFRKTFERIGDNNFDSVVIDEVVTEKVKGRTVTGLKNVVIFNSEHEYLNWLYSDFKKMGAVID